MIGQPTYPDITVQLTGEDGNGALIIGRIAHALRRGVGKEAADKFVNEAMDQPSYDALLRLAIKTVDVI